MTTIQDRLRSGVDNCDTDSRGVELGGVVLTMNQAADRIDALEKALREIAEMTEDYSPLTGNSIPTTTSKAARAALGEGE